MSYGSFSLVRSLGGPLRSAQRQGHLMLKSPSCVEGQLLDKKRGVLAVYVQLLGVHLVYGGVPEMSVSRLRPGSREATTRDAVR